MSAATGRGATHLRDSAQYGHLWVTEPMRAWFDEDHRLRCWLGIYASLAAAQADLGLVPRFAADRIGEVARDGEVDVADVAAATVRTGHSTAGLVAWLQKQVGDESAPYVGLGATVQDISDTWTALTLRRTGELAGEDLAALLQLLRVLTVRHRTTPMAARTHGQVGVPVTLGFKTAGWGAECARHLGRLAEGRVRWETAPLGGSVGSIAYWGRTGPDLLEAFAARTGLGVAELPWGSARDAVAEFACWAQLVATLLARIGNEVYQLQRTEIGELAEAVTPGHISSVTMPHKRNPELAEHLVTLRRLVSAAAGLLVDAALVEHERDGRAWKIEWVALPDLCCALTRATRACVELVSGLQVHGDRMALNLAAVATTSEQAVTALAGLLGRDRAFSAVRAAVERAGPGGSWPAELAADPTVAGSGLSFDAEDAERAALAGAEAFVDRWLRAGAQ